jgi:clan AA aspartic protease (TIGR02281 family)
MRTVCALLSVVFLLPASAARADEPLPDLAAVRARVKAAAIKPAAWRETIVSTSTDGLTTTVQNLHKGDDWRDIVERGPFHTEQGSIKGQAWHQNDNGQSVVDEPDPGHAAPEKTTTTLTRVNTPVEAYVVAELNAHGWGEKEYVDPATWLIVRDEEIGASGVVVTSYDDIRPDAGRTFAHHWTTKSDYSRTTRESRVTAYGADDVSAAEVAMPPNRRDLVTFPAGVTSAALPAKFGRDHVFVRVTVNGRGLDFLLDTGASGITLDNDVARQLGLTAYGTHSAITAGRYTTARTIVPEMHVGQLVMKDVAVQLVPDGTSEEFGVRTVGLLGFDFLAELGVTIDYEHERVTAVPEPLYAVPAEKHVIPIDVRIGDGSPLVSVTVNGALGERFTIDTGGPGTFMIFDSFARKHPEALHDEGGGGEEARGMRFTGIGGAIKTQPYQIKSLKFGPISFQDYVGYRVMSASSYEGEDDGIIGVDFLKLFTVGLDYANSRLYLVPNIYGRRAFGIKD